MQAADRAKTRTNRQTITCLSFVRPPTVGVEFVVSRLVSCSVPLRYNIVGRTCDMYTNYITRLHYVIYICYLHVGTLNVVGDFVTGFCDITRYIVFRLHSR